MSGVQQIEWQSVPKKIRDSIKKDYGMTKIDEDQPLPFDDLGWQYFNTTGAPDTATESDARNFKEYEFTADNLNEYSAFSVKIVGQGTNTSAIPMVAALRCIAIT
jgi:hypothetical protein